MRNNKIFLFILTLIAISLIFSKNTQVLSQEITPTPENNKTEQEKPKHVEYNLSYPGMLPDNPLYKLKVLRDRASLFLINEPQKRVEYYILQTDKGILATAMLVDKNKIDLAMQTALKAENNYTLLTHEFGRFKEKPNQGFFQKLNTAALKHQEVLNSIIQRVPKEKQKTFQDVLYFSNLNLESVEKFKNKRYFNKQ